MYMSCPHQSFSRRRAPAAATGLAAGAYTNPMIWQDFANIDVIRAGNTYYTSASTMHYSPGAPVLRSYGLVHWEIAGHSAPFFPTRPANGQYILKSSGGPRCSLSRSTSQRRLAQEMS